MKLQIKLYPSVDVSLKYWNVWDLEFALGIQYLSICLDNYFE